MGNNKGNVQITQADLEKMANQLGLSLEDIEKNVSTKVSHDKLFEYIQPLLYIEKVDDDTEDRHRSLKQEDDTPKLKDAEAESYGQVVAQIAKNDQDKALLELLESSDLSGLAIQEDHYSELHQERSEEKRKDIEEKVRKIIALIEQFKNQQISGPQLMSRIDTVMPLKAHPELHQFLKSNGIDTGQPKQQAPQKIHNEIVQSTQRQDAQRPMSINELVTSIMDRSAMLEGPSSAMKTTEAQSKAEGRSR